MSDIELKLYKNKQNASKIVNENDLKYNKKNVILLS